MDWRKGHRIMSHEKRWTVFVPITPVAQPRQRISTIGGRARSYLPKKHAVHGYKLALQHAVREAGIEVGDGPLTVELVCYLPMPASWSKKKRAALLHSPHCQKPDLDNLAKAVLDGLLPVIGDDCRVWQFDVLRKLWAEHGGIGITIEELT